MTHDDIPQGEVTRLLHAAVGGDRDALDRLVPLAARGHALFPDRIASPADRARRTAAWLEGR